MLRTIIVEDEQLAASRLEKMVNESGHGLEVVAKLESVSETVSWLKAHPQPDLIFLDIHLEDGLSFSIFDQIKVDSPIIFTTAFDEYAIKAFKLKSIDYLLKPVSGDELKKAISKFREWNGKSQTIDLNELRKLVTSTVKSFRERFSVTVGEKLKSIETAEIAYFYSASGITFMVTKNKNQYAMESSLDNLWPDLDPRRFSGSTGNTWSACSRSPTSIFFPRVALNWNLYLPPLKLFLSASIRFLILKIGSTGRQSDLPETI